MKERNLAAAVRSAAGRDKITTVREKDLVLSLGAGVITGDGSKTLGSAGSDADQADALCLLGVEQERRDLLAGADPELGEGRGEVTLDGALREQKPFGDLAVGKSPGDEG